MNFKHTVSRLTAGLLLVSALVTPAFAATGTVNTEGSSLRLRSEANTGSSVLKTLGHGTSPIWQTAGIRSLTRAPLAMYPANT